MNSRKTAFCRNTASFLSAAALCLTAIATGTIEARADTLIKAYVGQSVVLHIDGKPSKDHVWTFNSEMSSAQDAVEVKKLGWSMRPGAAHGAGTLRYVAKPQSVGTATVVIDYRRKYRKEPPIKSVTYRIVVSPADPGLSTASTQKMPWQE